MKRIGKIALFYLFLLLAFGASKAAKFFTKQANKLKRDIW